MKQFKNILQFLSKLSANNNKDWMDENRAEYNECRDWFRQYSATLIAQVAQFDGSVNDLQVKNAVYRINRNNRFNKDLPPYKDYFAITISKGGKKSVYAEYYFHLSPFNQSCIGIGKWGPDSSAINKIRQEIDYNPKPLLSFINDPKIKKEFGEFYQKDKLKNAPRNYSVDHKNIELLRLKHFSIFKGYTDFEVCKDPFTQKMLDLFEKTKPLVDYLNTALEEV